MVNPTKEDLLNIKADDFEESIKRATLGVLKTEAILEGLKRIKKGIGLDEKFYIKKERDKKRENKIKKILYRMIIIIGILVVGVMIESECIDFLPSWVLPTAVNFFGIIFILMVLIGIHYEEIV